MVMPATRTGPDTSFFPDDAVIRRVHREGIVLLGAGRALLMQLAHPLVAKGVAEHSSFQSNRRQRLLRTLKPTLAIVFGSQAQARQAAAGIGAVHEHVSGEGYRAEDPKLLFWVLATLIDSALLIHERFLRPLTHDEQEDYYQESLRAGELLGVLRELAPPDMASFHEYMASAMPSLEVTDQARALARDLFAWDGLAAPGGWFLRQATTALLPQELRESYGLAWSPGQARTVTALIRASGTLLRRTPASLRRLPWFLLPPRAAEEDAAPLTDRPERVERQAEYKAR